MNFSRTPHRIESSAAEGIASRPAGRLRRRGAAGAGLLAAVALAALSAAGTAHADSSAPKVSERPGAASAPAAAPAGHGTPSAAPAAPSGRGASADAPKVVSPGRGAPAAVPGKGAEPSAAPEGRPAVRGTGTGSDKAQPSAHRGSGKAAVEADGRKQLAHTGASPAATVAMSGTAAGLIAAGGGTVFAVRRRRA
ncbi:MULTISPECIES: hypothetical protein [Streptomyces]|uniref:hypothetical protein n=1 Tax=Streptomyces TaxID=1883 RepID=UPI000B9E2DB2|nr:hypothetical protein [Streptomyces kasugaensis]